MSFNYVALPIPSRSELEERYNGHADAWERALFEIHRRIRSQLMDLGLRATVKYRVKEFQSYYKKLLRRGAPLGLENGQNGVNGHSEQGVSGAAPECVPVTDLLGIRIVCPFMEDLSTVEQILAQEYRVVEREQKGAEFSFKEFGYESTHYLLNIPGDVVDSFHIDADLVFEVQLRTILQDAWAEVEHELVYKSEFTPFDDPMRRKLAALNANLSLADIIFHEIRVFQRELQQQIRQRRSAFSTFLSDEFSSTPDPSQGSAVRDALGDSAAPSPEVAPPAGDGAAPGDEPEGGIDIIQQTTGAANTTDSLLLKALYAHNRSDYPRAVELYSKILESEPRSAVYFVVVLHRGMAYFALGDYAAALQDFERSLGSKGDLRRSYHYRGLAHRQLGDDGAAQEDFCRSLELDPFQYEVLMSRAQVYHRTGDLAGALKDCDAALSLEPDSSEARRFHSLLTQELGM